MEEERTNEYLLPDNAETGSEPVGASAAAPELEDTVSQSEAVPSRMPVAAQLAILGLILLVIFSTSAVPRILANLRGEEVAPTSEVAAAEPDTIAFADLSAFDGITVAAESAFVWDVRAQRVLYEKSPDEQWPLASITKLMTALVAFEIISRDTTVEVPRLAILQDGDSGLADGEAFSLGTLADLTLMTSSNDGAFAIAAAAGALLDPDEPAHTFVEAMNIRADELNLTQTYFRNPTGLDISESEAGAYGSARDVAFLMEYILEHQPEMLEATSKAGSRFYNESGAYHEAENTNAIVRNIPGLLGSKTGYTTLAGGNLAIAFDASLNRPVIVVVLGSSYDGRFTDVHTLAEAARASLSQE